MKITKTVNDILVEAYKIANNKRHEYVTPEHLLLASLKNKRFLEAIKGCGGDAQKLTDNLNDYLDKYVSKVEGKDAKESFGMENILFIATQQAVFSGKNKIDLEHIISALYELENSYAVYYLNEQGINKRDLLFDLCHRESEIMFENSNDEIFLDNNLNDEYDDAEKLDKETIIKKYAKNLTQEVNQINKDPLIGRQDILDRTIQILCRRTKNNPIHVGEVGVGKTAITLGLAKLIVEKKVPEKLKNAEIFSLDVGSLLAGTRYRGDFEERMKVLLDEIMTRENPIVYIDEIHTIVGSGALEGGSLDGASLIKSYLLEGKIKFIGATTYDEYKKYFEKDKGLSRRFQIIDVKEPSKDEAVKILEGLKKNFEDYHNVKYTNRALVSAVNLSSKYINDRYLPDKAIDIIDEAGAYMSMVRKDRRTKKIDEGIIEKIIAKMCNIPKETVEGNEVQSLKNLEATMKKNIFGQDTAIENVVRCIKMSRAGLNDENKPVASMLFVGPTGVGKTEIAKVLANSLGIEFVRFDMSEYGEKHAASKLIGSPPGYVGYEEGGLLTDTIRKKPNCVLLLDEVEKAHRDILNVLLQIMDYATLTDNKGRKADFKNVIIIMTSNAGARYVGKNLVGFLDREVKKDVINEEVKKFFSPEFRNRLDKIIVFNDIDKDMSINIVKKQLAIFNERLKNKNINVTFRESVIEYIADTGTSKEFGAREILRVINTQLKPLLVDKILFDDLRDGLKYDIDYEMGKFKLNKIENE
ncbi:MAG: AAA family ATPase [Sarcina ventriculi]|uniref:ATP-dependent Clp protease ATP-binding subunit ClpA n=1 Tax=Sarcina ventriculi TaxID=1267 RepID=A0ABM9UKX5_SARVE|nr:AAA family ATPase [Sarcina ventriculi]MDO4402526.1 AAA family ATPase [Clostridiaceae bacterium]MBU5321803.1 AAA family ATPase [Sarcina ventriculi]MCI5635559.1 AAA family ATPase [Sarcina ventriculi]MDD7373019.1 AAA family ATPase [Sarcina ventriculi]MDY7063282.1 AAA family ATPase [Sarcina ventriculi]